MEEYKNITEGEAIALLNSHWTSDKNRVNAYNDLPNRLKKDIQFNIRVLN